MKGQMFLIAAVVIAVSLIIAKLTVKAPTVAEERKLLEMKYEKEFLDNLEEELKNSIRFSTNEKENITKNAFDFANLSRVKASEHALDFELLFVGSYANYSSSSLNVSLINLLNKPINASLNLNGTVKNQSVTDYGRWDAGFDITPGSKYNLTISYNTSYSQFVWIKTKTNKDAYVAFFDLTLNSSEAVHTKKFEKDYLLN